MAVRCHSEPNGRGRSHRTSRRGPHNAAMHARVHKGAHSRLVAPHCAGPESTIGIAKDRDREASTRTLGLTRGAKGLDQEPRQVSPRPNPGPRDGHEGHKPNDLPVELDHQPAATRNGVLRRGSDHGLSAHLRQIRSTRR